MIIPPIFSCRFLSHTKWTMHPDLPPKYKQNTGCLIDIVYKNSAAYFANLCHGDIITRINGSDIFTAEDFYRFRKNAETGDTWKIKIVRDGAEKEITLIYGLDKLMN